MLLCVTGDGAPREMGAEARAMFRGGNAAHVAGTTTAILKWEEIPNAGHGFAAKIFTP
ncbi:hypothetical protein GCM10010961_35610 [Pseudodonghicola xiamenensis]|uniref:Uncharacterized protein n=1 Tax=Pseudodonghicola xiamenensis TaxID=337702 RepID=A0A8J3MDY1_9RHOB|nr:hypothetical protein GCM10010961_35610 [Pseudodonghicola xiamenensis]